MRIFISKQTFGANHIPALQALHMVSEIIIVIVCNFTSITQKRSLKRHILRGNTYVRSNWSLPCCLSFQSLLIKLGCSVQRCPNIAEFWNCTKRTPFKLVQKMTKSVRAFYEMRCLNFDCKLYFCSNYIIELNIN